MLLHLQKNKQESTRKYAINEDTTLRDFYYFNRGAEERFASNQKDQESNATTDSLNLQKWKDKQIYELCFSNRGGMVMPIIIEWTYKDGTTEVDRIPVGIWKLNEQQVYKTFIKDKDVAAIRLDPYRETADINEVNGQWPVKEMPTRFELFKESGGGGRRTRGQSNGGNAMQRATGQQ